MRGRKEHGYHLSKSGAFWLGVFMGVAGGVSNAATREAHAEAVREAWWAGFAAGRIGADPCPPEA